MKAAVLNAYDGKFDIQELAIDEPRGREVLVSVKASGLCHTDLHFGAYAFGAQLPAVFGHELAGVVEAIGPDVRDLSVGVHVVGSLIAHCGHCAPCLHQRTFQCEHPEETLRPKESPSRLMQGETPVNAMFGTAAFAEKALVHENQLARVPAAMPFPQAALLGCGIITGVGAVLNTAQVRPGETVAVIGAGGVGLNVISGAHIAGATRIIAVDTQSAKQVLAQRFGATDFVNSAQEDVIGRVREIAHGGGVDHVFEAVGLPATVKQAIAMVRKGGGVFVIGVAQPGAVVEVELLGDLLARQIMVKGVYMGSSNIKNDIPRLANEYLNGRLNIDDLVSREIDISDINAAYDDLIKGNIARCVITSFNGA